MLLSSDKISQTVIFEIDPINGERLETLRLHNLQANKRKTTWAERRFENLAKINDKNAIRTMMLTKHPRGWLWSEKGIESQKQSKVRPDPIINSTKDGKQNKGLHRSRGETVP